MPVTKSYLENVNFSRLFQFYLIKKRIVYYSIVLVYTCEVGLFRCKIEKRSISWSRLKNIFNVMKLSFPDHVKCVCVCVCIYIPVYCKVKMKAKKKKKGADGK